MAATQKIVVNKKLHIFTSDYYQHLFKPSYSAFENTSDFKVMHDSNKTNGAYTLYSETNSIHGAFITTESTIKVINALQRTMYNGEDNSYKYSFVDYEFNADGSINWGNSSVSSERCALFGKDTLGGYQSYYGHSTYGMYYTGETESFAKVSVQTRYESQSFAEVLLRHLYSVHPQFRNDAFDAIGTLLGTSQVPTSALSKAKRCWIPLVDFDSSKFEFNMDNQMITATYNEPVKLEQQFRYNVHNPDGETLYLFFPIIQNSTINDNHVSILTGPRGTYGSGCRQTTDNGLEWTPASSMKNKPTLSTVMMYSANADYEAAERTPMIPYLALTITDQTGTGDIQFDYIDEVDYIDKFRIKINGLVELVQTSVTA